MLVPGIPDTLGSILGIANTIGQIINKFDNDKHESPVEVVEKPVIIQQPSAPVVPVAASNQPTQPININLTINIYTDEGKLLTLTKKQE